MPRKLVPATVVFLLWAAPAAAESGPPSVWAAAAQYVEMMPTSTGPKAAGAPGVTKPLPASIATQLALRGGSDRKALETLVTSSGWGAAVTRHAPKQEPGGKAGGNAGGEKLAVPLPQQGASFPDAAGAAVTGSSRGVFALAAVLGMLAAVALVRFGATRR